ncbi:YciI family protein [Maridesulfovibrio salexigens]|uniref:YCII-related n=1 Tax=Maridesulfovibrio salexigens (strain ATCC 14822 / DSM 2638 / NCIMB 8403 / VKM B-1763) TaxID=526222 RepID=C6BXB8_MARSD|nr:YciI family protein [Maridesulfovibrio salexigens]ACS80424.1 YCII-related [Maridesulfovibrio salexigens DSM 2638]
MKWVLLAFLVMFSVTPAFGGDMENDSKGTFVYYYLMEGNPDAIGKAVPAHVEYWKTCNLAGFRGGPFADGSGGMIIFETEDDGSAAEIIAGDPFVIEGFISESRLKQWIPK